MGLVALAEMEGALGLRDRSGAWSIDFEVG